MGLCVVRLQISVRADTPIYRFQAIYANIALKRCQDADKPGEAPTLGSRKGGSAMQSSSAGSNLCVDV
jgi:hypothetical protein